jgi:hypothetical protein
MIQPIAIAALLLAQGAAPPAPAAPPPCLQREGVRDAFMVLAPHLVQAVANKCKAHLPATAFLNMRGTDLVARMKTDAAGRAPSAAGAIRAVAGDKVPEAADPEALVTLGGLFGMAIASEMKPESCGEMSNLVESLAPLPTENIGRAIVSVLILSKFGEKDGKLSICPNG